MTTSSPIGNRVERSAQTSGTWAGGTTSAIYAYPSDALGTPATARLWVGTAVIDRASAYSFFAERLRLHMPIHGNGIHLHFQKPAEMIELHTYAQLRFDGARPVQVTLVDGAVIVFNLIVQTSVAAELQLLKLDQQARVLELDQALPDAPTADRVVRIVYAASGTVALAIGAQPAITLLPADAFVFHPRPLGDQLGVPVELRGLAPAAAVVVATLVFDSALPAHGP